jgi:hypothetical protein
MALPTEHAEQVSLCGWLDTRLPELDYFAIPNGGERNAIVAQKLKAEGVKAGVPDMFIPSLNLFLELKRVKGGHVSPVQKYWHERLTNCGYTVAVCKGAAEAVKVITQHIGARNA